MLNHLNLAVLDPPRVAEFLVRHGGMRVMDDRNRAFIFLSDANGMVLALMRDRTAAYPATFHVGFILPDAEAVVARRAALEAEGFEVTPEGDGSSFHAWADGSLMVQFLAR